jgi:hypothetical protein
MSVDAVVKMVHEVGALVHFLPPYSPDYNPIVSIFQRSRAMDINSFEIPVTAENCQQWIMNAGIYN